MHSLILGALAHNSKYYQLSIIGYSLEDPHFAYLAIRMSHNSSHNYSLTGESDTTDFNPMMALLSAKFHLQVVVIEILHCNYVTLQWLFAVVV